MYEINHIKSLAEQILPNCSIITSDELIFGELSNSQNASRVIISPVDELLFLTKRVRQLIYSDNKNDSNLGANLDSKIKKFLELSKKLIGQDIGGEASEE